LGFLATQAGDLRAAQECLTEALELAQRTGYPSEQARALICLHTCYALAGEIDKATAANTEALGLAEFHELAGLSAECHLAYADRLITQGDLEGSSEHLRRARLFANQADDASCRIRIALGGARRAMTQGDYQEAAEELTAVLARYPMLDQSPEGLQGRGLLGVALFALAVPTGESMTEQALLACDQAGWVVGACIIRLMALLAAVHVEDSARIRAHHEAVVREAQTRGLQVIVTVARNLIDRPLRLPLPLRPGQAAAIV
jgi:tetratricopeptide (TPR) repeat protein